MYGSNNFLLTRAQGEENQRLQIIDMVMSRKKMSENHYIGVRQALPRRYDLWRGTWTGRFHPHKNNVHIPLIYSAVWADAARKASTSLNMWPIVTFLGYGPDDMPIARKREALISAQMKDDGFYLKQVHNFVSADLYGVGVSQVGWKRQREERMIETIDRLPLSGRTVKMIKQGPVTMFDGPTVENVDLLDCFPDINNNMIQNMAWFIRRYFLDLDDLRFLASEEMGVFDKAELDRMEREGGVGWDRYTDEATVRRFAMRTGMDETSARFMDKYSRPVEILEFWGYVPSELIPPRFKGKGRPGMFVITVANGRYLLRFRPNPFWHGLKPFHAYSPTPCPHYFFAPGKAEVMEKIQITGNRYINQSLDAADLVIDPMWFYDRSSNLNTKNLYSHPGRFIPVDGNPGQVMAPLQANLSGLLNVAADKLNQMQQFGNMASGIVDDAVAGLEGSSDRQTAREFIGRREAAGNRLLLESRLYEEMYLEPVANMMVALDKQFLELPIEVLILGDNAVMDPVTQTAINATREQLADHDLTPNYAARAVGSTVALSRSMKQQTLLQLLTAMGSPLGQSIMGQINAVNFWRGIFREFEVPNVNEIFMQQPLQQLLSGQNGGAPMPLGMVPTSGQMVRGQMPRGVEGGAAAPMASMRGIPMGMDMRNTLAPAGAAA